MTKLTPKAVAYIAKEEGMVREAYKDSIGVWTWGLGVTNMSGHEVYPRYKDAPQPLEKCIEVSVWLMERKYLPPVLKAFHDLPLKEHELAGALSFNWNTGAIGKASWVGLFLDGKLEQARASFLSWKNPASIIPRRQREAALFFDGQWPDDMRATIWNVAKPSYTPRGSKAVDIMPMLEQAMGGT